VTHSYPPSHLLNRAAIQHMIATILCVERKCHLGSIRVFDLVRGPAGLLLPHRPAAFDKH